MVDVFETSASALLIVGMLIIVFARPLAHSEKDWQQRILKQDVPIGLLVNSLRFVGILFVLFGLIDLLRSIL